MSCEVLVRNQLNFRVWRRVQHAQHTITPKWGKLMSNLRALGQLEEFKTNSHDDTICAEAQFINIYITGVICEL